MSKLQELNRGRIDMLGPAAQLIGDEIASYVMEDGKVLVATEQSLIVCPAPAASMEMQLHDWRSLRIGMSVTTGIPDKFHGTTIGVVTATIRLEPAGLVIDRPPTYAEAFDDFWRECLAHRENS